MKRTALALTFSALLISAVAGTQWINLGTANFTLPAPWDIPDTNPPSINILSPTQNQAYNSNNVTLTFVVTKPETWFSSVYIHKPNFAGSYEVYYSIGVLTLVRYNLDGKESENITANDERGSRRESPFPKTLSFSINITELSEGPHNVTVIAEGTSYYLPKELYGYPRNSKVVGYSNTTYFSIDNTPPVILSLSVRNGTYFTNDIPLNFKTKEPLSWIRYSIDGQENVTLNGNTTIPQLSEGSHFLTIYVNDLAGNTGTSETIYFSIEPFPTTLVIAPIASVAVVGLGLLIYFKKRNHSP